MLIRAGSFHAGRRFVISSYARPQGLNIVGIGMDGLGMRADLLDKKLSSWNESDGRRPRVAYIVPYGSNVGKADVELDKIQVVRPCPWNDVKNYTPSSRNTIS
jgi:hypothetical protein